MLTYWTRTYRAHMLSVTKDRKLEYIVNALVEEHVGSGPARLGNWAAGTLQASV